MDSLQTHPFFRDGITFFCLQYKFSYHKKKGDDNHETI